MSQIPHASAAAEKPLSSYSAVFRDYKHNREIRKIIPAISLNHANEEARKFETVRVRLMSITLMGGAK